MYGTFLWFIFLFSFSYSEYSFVTQIVISGIRIVMHQSIPAAPSLTPPPLPRATAGHLPALSVSGVGRLQILRCPGPGICQPRAFDTHAVSCQNTTAQRILLEKQGDWLICQGQETIEEVCKGMFSILCMHVFIAYQARITGKWSYRRNQRLLNQISVEYFKNILPYF